MTMSQLSNDPGESSTVKINQTPREQAKLLNNNNINENNNRNFDSTMNTIPLINTMKESTIEPPKQTIPKEISTFLVMISGQIESCLVKL